MPSTYAHFKFANEVLPLLPEDMQRAARGNMTLYLTGCHGPDILFYYKAVKKNAVNRQGYAMHGESAAPFFERAKGLARADGEPSLSYIAGFITHFALDSECHGYVESERKKLGITHTKLEVEFDRSLLEGDGKNAIKEKLAEHIKAGKDCARTIAPFFSLGEKQIVRALKDMRAICNIFVCPGRVKRGIVGGILKMMSDELPDQIMRPLADPACNESNAVLKNKFEGAKPVAAQLAEDFMRNLYCQGLCERFDRNYE